MFLYFFLWGLKLEIRRELLLAKPTDLADAVAKAQLFEDRNDDFVNRQRVDNNHSGWISRAGTPLTVHSTTAFSSLEQSPMTSNVTSSPAGVRVVPLLPVIKLTTAEMKERHEKGLCYTCDEKFHYGHKCKNRMLIMCVHEDDEREDMMDASNPYFDSPEEEMSLHSLSNSLNPTIFRIMATHGKESLEVLVDTGSNNNFIQEALVYQLKLCSEDTKWFKVYMSNGNF